MIKLFIKHTIYCIIIFRIAQLILGGSSVDRKYKYIALLICIISISLFMVGCVPGDGYNTAENPAGFFWGIWHGWVAPISLILGLFEKNIRVYEIHNSGWWYDFGFYIAIISGFGGISLFRSKKKRRL